MSEKNDAHSELKGNTLKVYIYTLKMGTVGVREAQRSLRFSNPSLAQYHLSKLKDMGLVREEGGQYMVVDEVKVDAMRHFLKLGTFLVPRLVFYAIFFTVFTLYLGIASLQLYPGLPLAVWFVALLVLACGIFWYESFRAWRSAP